MMRAFEHARRQAMLIIDHSLTRPHALMARDLGSHGPSIIRQTHWAVGLRLPDLEDRRALSVQAHVEGVSRGCLLPRIPR